MKKIVCALIAACVSLAMSGIMCAQGNKGLTLNDINIRDPYILPVAKEGMY